MPPATAGRTSSPKPPPPASSSAFTSESPASSSACSSWCSATAAGQCPQHQKLQSVAMAADRGSPCCRPQIDDMQDCPGHAPCGTQRGTRILFLLPWSVCAERRRKARAGGQRRRYGEESGRHQRAGETFHATRPTRHSELAAVSAGGGWKVDTFCIHLIFPVFSPTPAF